MNEPPKAAQAAGGRARTSCQARVPSRPKEVESGSDAAAPVHNELPKKTGMMTLSTLGLNLRDHQWVSLRRGGCPEKGSSELRLGIKERKMDCQRKGARCKKWF